MVDTSVSKHYIIDMYEKTIRIGRNTDRKVTIVEWTLGNRCTFACSYCPDILHDGSAGWHDHEKLTDFLDVCYDHYHNKLGREVIVQYTGGEPTVYPKFKKLIAYAKERGIKQSIISNASRTARFWKEVAPVFDKVHLSYHGEFVDPDHFIEIANIVEETTNLHVNMLMLPNRFDELLTVATRIRNECPNSSIQLKPLQIGFGEELYPYSDAEKKILDTMHGFVGISDQRGDFPTGQLKITNADGSESTTVSNTLILDGVNKFSGWTCDIGLDTLNVDMWGKVWGGLCHVGGSYGNIYKGSYTLPTGPTICNTEWCTCHLDLMVTKRK
jgi:organic radical activating enzyme